jgi:hypothetical protein
MNFTTIKPSHVTAAARYLLNLEQSAIRKKYRRDWEQNRRHLQEGLEVFSNLATRTPGETFIEHFDRGLYSLSQNTRALVRRLTKTSQYQLSAYLQN